MILFYDLETSGLPGREAPHIVSIGAILTDNTYRIMDRLHLYVKPNGWTIHPKAQEVHGITMEYCEANGIPEAEALAMLLRLSVHANYRVGYNEQFDARIVRAAIQRFSPHMEPVWATQRTECVMHMAKTVQGGNRPPSLTYAVQAHLGRKHDTAHEAWGDAVATMDLHKVLAPQAAALKTVKEVIGIASTAAKLSQTPKGVKKLKKVLTSFTAT